MNAFAFDEIPLQGWYEPGVFIEVRENFRNIGLLPYPVQGFLICPRLSTGTLAPGEIREVTRDEEGTAFCGSGSAGEAMVKAWRKVNRVAPLFITTLDDDDAGVKTQKTLTFGGAVSQAITLRFKANGKQQLRIRALPSDTPSTLAQKLLDEINEHDSLPFTATAAGPQVTIEARHAGEIGDDIRLSVDRKAQPLPSGLTVTLVDARAGTGNPDIQSVLDLIANHWYTAIVNPYNDATNAEKFAEELRIRFLATSKLDAHGYVFKNGTFGVMSAFGESVNSQFLTTGGLNGTHTPSYVFAAQAGGLATFHLTNDPARQLRGLVLPDVEAPDSDEDIFLEEEQNLLLDRGVSTFDVLPDGAVTVSRMVTTYTFSDLGVENKAWIDIMIPATLSRIRYDWAAYIQLIYPRAKLVPDEEAINIETLQRQGDPTPGNSVASPQRIHASWAARCDLYARQAWIQEVTRTVRESQFSIDENDRSRLLSNLQIRIVGNLIVQAGALEFQP